ncbi:hypothetical protein ACIQVL_45860 [Streptomyces sp. NPDC090499]|uniref:hypothetical protein n=1 Tax=Streptomyces sp. NPDC090499 TaxID=3365965 RepID=UPI00380F98CB
MTADPEFRNPGNASTSSSCTGKNAYQVHASSPAIRAGTVISSNGGQDAFGNAVSATAAPNIGAYNGTGGNLLSNAGFETGALSPWTQASGNSSSVTAANARTGSDALTTAASTTATVYCWKNAGGSGAGYCDDLAVEPLSSATNAVTNPGYETGALTPWVQSTGTAAGVVASNACSGTYALQTAASASGAIQTVSGLTSSGTYLLVGWAKVATAGEEVAVGVKSFGGTETYLRASTTSYAQQPLSFTTGVSTTSAGVYCYKNSGSAAGYCDDYSLVKLL